MNEPDKNQSSTRGSPLCRQPRHSGQLTSASQTQTSTIRSHTPLFTSQMHVFYAPRTHTHAPAQRPATDPATLIFNDDTKRHCRWSPSRRRPTTFYQLTRGKSQTDVHKLTFSPPKTLNSVPDYPAMAKLML